MTKGLRVLNTRWESFVCAVAACLLSVVALASSQQQQLDALPERWARAATAGDVDSLMQLYSKEAYIHVVFTQEELRGMEEIRGYYAKYSLKKPKVTIIKVDENSILASKVGILSGYATVEFPGEKPMATHFSIVANWEQENWVVKLQTTVKVD